MSQPKRNTLATSEGVRQKAIEGRRTVMPLIVTDVGDGRLVTIAAHKLSELGIDATYQRDKITNECHRIVHALKSGGTVPDPVTLAQRQDGSLWIVDGQQRFWAHFDCQEPMRALIYRVKDYDTERALFNVMNDRVNLRGEHIVKAHPGQTATIIREWANKPQSPYNGHVNFGSNNRAPYPASILARGVLISGAGIQPWGGIKQVLARSDFALKNVDVQARVEAYMRLVPLVFPSMTRLKILPAVALGSVAHERWGREIHFPGPNVYERLKRVNWDVIVPSHSRRFLGMVCEQVVKRWPKPK